MKAQLTEQGEFLNRIEFENYIRETIGYFIIESCIGRDYYYVAHTIVGAWIEGTECEDFGLIYYTGKLNL